MTSLIPVPAAPATAAAATLPAALIVDFGGVIVSSTKPAGWQDVVADAVGELVGAENVPDRERLIADIAAGATAAGQWRNAMSRPMHPRELSQREFVMDFVAADWSPAQRAAVEPHIAAVAYRVAVAKERRALRPGMRELLDFCRVRGIPVAIVSNALSGQVHRDFLAAQGLSEYFVAEIYSDEVGMRKPNPDFLRMGCDATGHSPAECWYVGDHLDRDVLCGSRAGIGANVLMPSPNAAAHPTVFGISADITTHDPAGLLAHMKEIA